MAADARRVQRLRERGDYDALDATPADADEAIAAVEFVQAVEQLLRS